MAIEIIKPSTVAELDQALRGAAPSPAPKAPLAQYAVFRGVTDARWSLVHSLARTGGDVHSKESRILHDFQVAGASFLRADSVDTDNLLAVMSVAQHFGAPTRLLDWSRNPQVAQHFATLNQSPPACDGAIWVVNPHVVHAELPGPVRAILDPNDPTSPGVVSTRTFLRAYRDIGDFDKNFVFGKFMPLVFVEPEHISARFEAQSALFSMVADAECDVMEVLNDIDGACRKIIVPAHLKPEIRRRLDAERNTEQMYFPGLDGIGAFIARSYRE